MSVGICTGCGGVLSVGETCPNECAANISVPTEPPDFQPGAPSPAVSIRTPLVLVAPPPNNEVLVSTTTPNPVAKLSAWIDTIDTDNDGVPFYKDPDELKGMARWTWKGILFLAARLPDHTAVGKAADGIVGAVDRSGFRGDVDGL